MSERSVSRVITRKGEKPGRDRGQGRAFRNFVRKQDENGKDEEWCLRFLAGKMNGAGGLSVSKELHGIQ